MNDGDTLHGDFVGGPEAIAGAESSDYEDIWPEAIHHEPSPYNSDGDEPEEEHGLSDEDLDSYLSDDLSSDSFGHSDDYMEDEQRCQCHLAVGDNPICTAPYSVPGTARYFELHMDQPLYPGWVGAQAAYVPWCNCHQNG